MCWICLFVFFWFCNEMLAIGIRNWNGFRLFTTLLFFFLNISILFWVFFFGFWFIHNNKSVISKHYYSLLLFQLFGYFVVSFTLGIKCKTCVKVVLYQLCYIACPVKFIVIVCCLSMCYLHALFRFYGFALREHTIFQLCCAVVLLLLLWSVGLCVGFECYWGCAFAVFMTVCVCVCVNIVSCCCFVMRFLSYVWFRSILMILHWPWWNYYCYWPPMYYSLNWHFRTLWLAFLW